MSAASIDETSAALAALLDEPTPALRKAKTSGGGRPAGYKATDGKRVPGVTTILGRFKEAGGLIHWAWDLGIKGEDYRQARDDAADAGHVAHELIDADIHGREPDIKPDVDPEQVELARKGFEAFRAWRAQVKLEIVDTERPLVSESMRYGGTYDALGLANGVLVLLDWKSGNRLYAEHVVQCAAYRHLVHEHGGHDGQIPQEAYLLRVGKEYGDFHFHYFPKGVLDLAWEAFRRMRELYDLDAKLKKVIG